jgi:MoaA/NifB/PqqE/SkfB family radical SAM enzyme
MAKTKKRQTNQQVDFPSRFLLKKFINLIFLYLATKSRSFLNFVEPSPIEASIKVTERCNSRCITCNVWKSNPKNELTAEEIENIFYQLKEIGIKIVGFTGGEPLLRNDIGELIRKAKAIIGAKVYIITNGLLLEKRAKTLVEQGIDYVSVSIDGLEKTDEAVRGIPGCYNKAIKGIQALRNLDNNVKIHVGTTLVKPNLTDIPQLIEICKKLKVTWAFNLLDTKPYFFQGIDTSKLLINDERLVDEIINYLYKINKERPEMAMLGMNSTSLEFARNYLKNKKPHFYCMIGYLRVYIDSNSNIYSGCWALPPLSNLRERNLKEIIRSQEYKKRVKTMFSLNCPRCTCGYIISGLINHLPSTTIHFLKNLKKYKETFIN